MPIASIATRTAAPWMAVAGAEVGVATYPAGRSNPRIGEYHHGTPIAGYDDKAPWCSSFVNWCLGQVGIVGTRSALARSWLEWGQPLQQPRPGCIVVVYRDDPRSWKGHVGFYLRHDAQFVNLLGGNQLEQVCDHFYPLQSVLGYRWPAALGPDEVCDPGSAREPAASAQSPDRDHG